MLIGTPLYYYRGFWKNALHNICDGKRNKLPVKFHYLHRNILLIDR